MTKEKLTPFHFNHKVVKELDDCLEESEELIKPVCPNDRVDKELEEILKNGIEILKLMEVEND